METEDRERVLIVDDIPENIHIVSEILKESYQILAATSGELALEIARSQNRPDIILLDIMMPGMDGYDVISNLKSDPYTKNIPVIFVTAKDDTKSETLGFALGGGDYITKPIIPEILKARVKTHLELHKHKQNLEAMLEVRSKELLELNRELEKKVFEKTEENLAKSHIIKEQSRFAQMGELLQMIAHQWRQPLSVISMSVQSMEDSLFDERNCYEKIRHNIGLVVESTEHLSKTISMFARFFRPDEDIIEVGLKRLLEETVQLLKGIFEEGGITINLHAENEISVPVYQNTLREAVIKLLQNSKEAFEKNKTQHPKIEITLLEEESFAVIRVDDNGGGIDESILHKIYDPYFSTKTTLQKYGLGLYIAKNCIESYCRGTLGVKNIEGGARAEIKIDLSQK